MIGTTIAHYQITGLLGKGGMGEVYRARDTRLDRDVAIKILPADVAADPSRLDRFQREAKIVAGLNHPHIVTLFSVEEDNGVHFLTMELIEGQGLDAALSSEGLPLAKVLDIGIAVADALSAAHEKGIVHRDLKPGNVMLTTGGRAKVLDFGIAKRAPRDLGVTQTSPLTHDGAVMGTIRYMSPEQVRGERVDHRSDIFALGTMLYQLITGKLPFRGDYDHAIAYAIVNEAPRPVSGLRAGVPPELAHVVDACLAKDPAERYASAAIVRDELRALQTGTGSPPAKFAKPRRNLMWIGVAALIVLAATAAFMVLGKRTPSGQTKSIAVLPFANMSGDPTQEYFSDGISEELLNLLSKVRELRVAARTSSFSFKGTNVGIPEITKQLNVAYVLEGSVRRVGDQVRVTAQLIHAADGFRVWSETYDRKLDDIFAVQDAIAADVVGQLQIELLGSAPTTRKTDPEAYALYLQARELELQYTPESLEKADSLLQRTLEIDSTYAPAWVALGAVIANEANGGVIPMETGFARAREAVNRALAIDPGNGRANAALGNIELFYDDNAEAAAKHIERAIELDPTEQSALSVAGTLLALLGRVEECTAFREYQVRLDPVNLNTLYSVGLSQLWAGKLDESIATFRTLLGLSPDNGISRYQLGCALLFKGDAKSALAEFEKESVDAFRLIGLAVGYHALGRTADADVKLQELIANYENDAAGNIAAVYAYRGESDRAFEWMEKERANPAGSFVEINVEPLFRGLHDDPRWLPFLRSIGKSPEQLAKIKFNPTLPR